MIFDSESIYIEKDFIHSLNLNEKQREAVLYFDSPLLIIAGAGTGKTKTLISKIAVLIRGGVEPSRILAITFTNKAAEEMKRRVCDLVPHSYGLWCMTFHAFGARLLKMHHNEAGLKKDFVIYDEEDQKRLLSIVIRDLGFDKERLKASLYASLISRAKDDLIDAESYLFNARISGDATKITTGQIYLEYQRRLEESNALDFGDLILKTVNLLRNNKNLCEYYQNHFRYILVDEYQDTNRAQYVLIKILSQIHSNICVVGDPDQSIYSWRGADIRNILQFESDFKNSYTIVLEHNYRSTANILDAANRVIRNNTKRKEKNLYTTNERGEEVKVLECNDENDEALKVSSEIENLIKVYKLSEIAVFYRTNAQSRSFEEVFIRKRIPYRVIGTLRFYDRKEIKDILAYLRVIVNPYDVVSFTRIINASLAGIGEKTLEKIFDYSRLRGISFYDSIRLCDTISQSARKTLNTFVEMINRFREKKSRRQLHEFVQEIMIESGYWQMIEEEGDSGDETALNRLSNLQELINAIKDYEDYVRSKGELPTLEGYLENVSLTNSSDEISKPSDAITLMTLHLAKGLEFDVVFVTGLEEGLFPINSANSYEEDLEEERRLMYVGMTRARKKLYLTWAHTRRMFGRVYPNMVSRFVIEAGLERYSYKKSDDITIIEAKVFRKPKAEVGRIAIHPIFGRGRILEIVGSGEHAKIKIRFENGREHTFMLKFAPIEIL